MANTIQLNRPVTANVQVQQEVSTVTIERYIDVPGDRVVRAFIKELGRPIVLWSGIEYDQIGDWTEAQAVAKAVTILSAI